MTRPLDLMRQGKKAELWQMCCGYLNLSLEGFMTIQKRLLLEQIELLKGCEMGRRLMGGAMPETIQEFRAQVPLTTYDDYLPELLERSERWLPAKPALWVHTVGRAGEYNFKWVPLSASFLEEFERVAAGVALLGACNDRGDFPVKEHMRLLATMGTRDYGSGIVAYLIQEGLGCDLFPCNAPEMTFQKRMEEGFEEALSEGLDTVGGLPSILAYVGEVFAQRAKDVDARFLLSHPRAFARLAKGMVRSRLAGRPILPRDLWSLKSTVVGGADSGVFRERAEQLWGRRLLEVYGGTEGGLYATQTWDYEGMTFIPTLNFLELIPEGEWFRSQLDSSYRPRTVLLDEVREGKNYEPVITNFHGGIMTRYRLGDMVQITSLRNGTLNIDVPQMVFHSRADDLLDIAGLGRVTERMIWEAVENSSIPYVDWVASKEIVDNKPVLHVYMELREGNVASEESLAKTILGQFRRLDRKYRCNFYRLVGDMERVLDLSPVVVSLLPRGAFSSYTLQRQLEGMAGGRLNPTRINPSGEMLSTLRAPKVAVEAAPVTDAERTAAR